MKNIQTIGLIIESLSLILGFIFIDRTYLIECAIGKNRGKPMKRKEVIKWALLFIFMLVGGYLADKK